MFLSVLVVVATGIGLLAPVKASAATPHAASSSGASSTSSGSSTSASTTSSTVRPAYYLGASDGGVYAFGTANLGELRPQPLNQPIVTIAASPTGGGYWLAASDGGIFPYGSARFYGSTGNIRLNEPIVGMAPTPTGKGYWLVASDGGIFTFGDAVYYGSTGNIRLNKPIVGMAPTPTGKGYWLVASDGGIFTFGDAAYDGSTGNVTLNEPIVGMAPSPTGGYWLVASDGGIFNFGGAPYLGSTGGSPGPAPIVGMSATPYGADYPAGAVGTDISWPQCGGPYPAPNNPVSIVGVNDGATYSTNPCFASEARNAGPNLTVYINVDGVVQGDPRAMNGPAGACGSSDLVCQGYNWGAGSAQQSVTWVQGQGFSPQVWWLDVEGPCGSSNVLWRCGSDGQASNAAVIRGAIDTLHHDGLVAGIYSTYYQWPLITGGSTGNDTTNFPGLPIWIATVPSSQSQWAADCSDTLLRFAEGVPWLIQWLGGQGSPTDPYDGDLACPL